MVTASIAFEQGAASPGPGISMVGVGGLAVTLTNADDSGVISWEWELLDSPINSVLVPGILGTVASVLFTPDTAPDTPGCYRIKLTVQGANGSVACDVKNFAVPTSQGWILPPFRASAAELNFPGNEEGWESLLNSIFIALSTGGGTDELVKASATDTTPGNLDQKINPGIGITRTILNPGGNEVYQLDVTGGGGGAPWVEDLFTATAGQTAFTLSQPPTDAVSVIFAVNGVLYSTPSDYTLVGTSLTWLDALFVLETGDAVLVRYQ